MVGIIYPIKREPSIEAGVMTMAHSLAKKGMTRFPGTGVYFLPYRLPSGRYKVAFDDEDPALYLIESKKEREAEIERRREIRLRLEGLTGLDLRATSEYWDYSKSQGSTDRSHVSVVKLIDGPNTFDFKNPFNEITFNWLKVHPLIAPSLEAYQKGMANPLCLFYVYDEQEEVRKAFEAKKDVNEAIQILDKLSNDKRRKVAKLMGLPVNDLTPDEKVYNVLDTAIKSLEFKEGKYKGSSTINMFKHFVRLENDVLNARVLIEDALTLNIYVQKADGIYEGNNKIAGTEEQAATYLLSPEHQEEFLALMEKVKFKKMQIIQ